MTVRAKIFTDFNDILYIEQLWNHEFALSFENPQLYSRIFCGVMHFCETRGWTPLIVTFWSGNRIVGMAPLKIRKFLNKNYVCSIADDIYSDFVFFDEYQESCINLLLETLFNRLNCMSATITLESFPILRALEKNCLKNIQTSVKPDNSGRAIIPVNNSYDQFYMSLKHNVRNHFSRMKKKIEGLGS